MRKARRKATKANEHVRVDIHAREYERDESETSEPNEISQIHLIPYTQPKKRLISAERDDVIFARRGSHPLTRKGVASPRRERAAINLPSPISYLRSSRVGL